MTVDVDKGLAGVWFAIPVAQADRARASATFELWKAKGYSTAALVDRGCCSLPNADIVISYGVYKGWAWAVNELFRHLLPEWLVTGGADVAPDKVMMADDIARQCQEHFGGTFGVMQPCGDRFGALSQFPPTAFPTPWIGREYGLRANKGKGPMWDGYPHYFADAELMAVATLAKRAWLRLNLCQHHDHWSRKTPATPAPHLTKWRVTWAGSHDLFKARQAAAFPGSEFLA